MDFTNAFARADIPSEEQIFINLSRDFKIDGNHHDVVIQLKKSLYGQAKAARLWYKIFWNGLLEHVFVMIKVYSCLCMSNTVIGVLYVDDCL